MSSTDRRILVTGASGFLGRRIVEILSEHCFVIRALVRKTSRLEGLRLPGVELVYGDVTDLESMRPAFTDSDYVVHAAAGTHGTDEQMRRVTIEGTRNVIELCRQIPIRKLVYISSCSVYGVATCSPGAVLDESALLEPHAENRGAYSWTKLAAEKVVTESMNGGDVAAVCLRPGTIYGPGGENFTPMVGFSLKNRLLVVINQKKIILPLVYIDNLIDAIFLALTCEKSTGNIYNVVDPEQVGKRRYIETFVRKMYRRALCVYIPFGLFAAVVAVQEKLFEMLRRRPVLTSYRLASSQNPVIYDSSKIIKDLGWRQRFSFAEAVDLIVAHAADLSFSRKR